MSNECIHTHSNLAKYGIWSIDCAIWDMGYWGVKHLGYGILGVKNLGYGILGGKKSGIWDMGTPVSPPPLYDRRTVKRLFAVGDWVMRYYTPAKKCKLDSCRVDWTLSDSVAHWLGTWDTKRLGIPNSDSTLLGYQESPTSAGGRILVTNEAIIGCPIGSDPWCQYYATNVAEFTFVNGGSPG